ncbi:Uncharacterised protein [Chlamydia abortus]|nr:Uncharacterised protein [Chlamydia abortus]
METRFRAMFVKYRDFPQKLCRRAAMLLKFDFVNDHEVFRMQLFSGDFVINAVNRIFGQGSEEIVQLFFIVESFNLKDHVNSTLC